MKYVRILIIIIFNKAVAHREKRQRIKTTDKMLIINDPSEYS